MAINVSDVLQKEGHAVAYQGGNKEEVQAKHLVNRTKLLREVPTPEGMSKVKNAYNEFKATKPPLKKKKNKK